MKTLSKISILFILTSSLLYLCSSILSPIEQTVNAENETSDSTIGGIAVEGQNKNELITLLNEKVKEWNKSTIVITGNDVEIDLLPEWFTFDVEGTVDDFISRTDKAWFAFWESTPNVHVPMKFTVNQEVNNLIDEQAQLDSAATLANIKERVGILSTESIESVALDMSLFQIERVAFELEEIPNNTINLNDVIRALNEQVIGSGEMFSLNQYIDGINTDSSIETINFVASVIYSAVLQTNFEVIERHSQGTMPNYLEPGIDVDINDMKDLKFINTNNSPASLKVSIKDSSLLVEIYSLPIETEAKYQVREKEQIKPRTIYRYSSELAPNEEELIQEGRPGLRVSVFRIVSDKKGPYEKEDLISKDYYPPVHRIILRSSVVPETPTTRYSDLSVDMNGDGLPDIVDAPKNTPDEEQTLNEEVSDELPEGSYYDKAGNIIDGSN